MAFEQIKAMNKRRVALIVGGGILFLVAVILVLPFLVPVPPRLLPEFALSEEVKTAYAEASSLAQEEGNYGAAIARLDAEIEALNAEGLLSDDDLYAEAKLKIYKADIYIFGTREYEKGFGLLFEVYKDLRYDDTVGGEALMLAMAHAAQGIDEGSLTISDVQSFVLDPASFGGVVGASVVDSSFYDELEEIDGFLVRGFARAIELTSAEKVYRLSQSYMVRLAAPYVPLPSEGEEYGLFLSDIQQIEADLSILAAGFISFQEPYEEFIAISLYNVLRAYEALPPAETDIVSNMERAYGELNEYVSAYPDDAAKAAPYLTNAAARVACRMVDVADFDAGSIDAEAISPYLDQVLQAGPIALPCPEAFKVIASEIDTRFAEYF
jgi:hypothetical protein